jgi:ubiquinone/menaquinone biosynthesis C-methylase UbiE
MNRNSNKIFESAGSWDQYDEKGYAEIDRVPLVLESIPGEVKSLIDIGCGNGIITNRIADKYEVTGVDISEAALENVRTRTLCCSATSIDLPDKSFDLVLSNELLEHLGDTDLDPAVSEMMRLSRKFILITVPFNENLEQSHIKCPECGYIFHIVGHLRSFNRHSLFSLFETQFRLIESKEFGRRVIRYNPALLRMRQKYTGQYYNPPANSVCPQCDNTEFRTKKGTALSKIFNGMNRIIGKRQPYWMLLLLERRED